MQACAVRGRAKNDTLLNVKSKHKRKLTFDQYNYYTENFSMCQTVVEIHRLGMRGLVYFKFKTVYNKKNY